MKINHIIVTVYRDFKIQIRAYPIDFFVGTTLSSFITILASFFMYKFMFYGRVSQQFSNYTHISDYMSYVIIGSFLYLFVMRTFLNVSRSIITEMREGTLDSLLLTPISQVSHLVGNMTFQTIMTTAEMSFLIIISIPFGLNLKNINLLSVILCIIISLLSSFGLSSLLGALMIYLKDTFICQNTVMSIISFICGVIFPVEFLPKWLQYISNLIPVTYSMKIFRTSMLLGTSIRSQYMDFLVLGILSIVYCTAGIIFTRKAIKYSIENQFI